MRQKIQKPNPSSLVVGFWFDRPHFGLTPVCRAYYRYVRTVPRYPAWYLMPTGTYQVPGTGTASQYLLSFQKRCLCFICFRLWESRKKTQKRFFASRTSVRYHPHIPPLQCSSLEWNNIGATTTPPPYISAPTPSKNQ